MLISTSGYLRDAAGYGVWTAIRCVCIAPRCSGYPEDALEYQQDSFKYPEDASEYHQDASGHPKQVKRR